jgi:anti-sigma B factor antagonist
MSDTSPNAALPAVPREDNDDQITITVRADGPRSLIVVGGEVDMLTSPQLRATVLDQLGETAGVQLVVLDLNAVTFLGTSGLAVLIEVREAAHMAGVELRLACTARRVLRPLTIAGLVSLFDIRDSQEAALTAT